MLSLFVAYLPYNLTPSHLYGKYLGFHPFRSQLEQTSSDVRRTKNKWLASSPSCTGSLKGIIDYVCNLAFHLGLLCKKLNSIYPITFNLDEEKKGSMFSC